MDQLTKFGPLQAIMKFWGTLTNTQKFVTVVFLSTSIVLLVIVSMVATKPKMAVLFSGLQSEDAGAVVAKLQESKIPYELEGSVIKVPEKNVLETRMQLANQGLPQGGNVGFELFDKSNFGMTEFDQRLKYQRALQGELSRTIDQLEQVAQSRVIIAIPEESVFSEKEKLPTASVTLKLRTGGTLGQEQIAGIVHLVSSAVQGLTPERVTIVDTRGNMLSEATGDPTGFDMRHNSSQLKLKRGYEQQMEMDIQSMLEGVLGPNQAVVRVNARINFDRKEISNELYQPGQGDLSKGILVSEDKMVENYGDSSSGAQGAQGAPGVTANLMSGARSASSGKNNGYKREQTTARYEVSKTIEHVVSAPGQVEKLSVAVMLDSKVSSEKRDAIERVVSAAAGIDENRGDIVTVEAIAFDNTLAKKEAKEMKAMESRSTYLSLGKTIGGALLLIVFLLFLKGVVKQMGSVATGSTKASGVNDGTAPAGSILNAVSSDQVATMTPPAGALQGYDSTQNQTNMTLPSAGDIPTPANNIAANVQPDEIAKALRKWMTE